MRVLLTGAAGNLGKAIGTYLVERGHHVVGTDVQYARGLPFVMHLADLRHHAEPYRLMEEGFDAVVHFGNIPNNIGISQELFATNTTINMNVAQAAVDVGVPKLVFASSIQAVSNVLRWTEEPRDTFPFTSLPVDGTEPARPGNPYALTKALGEEMLRYHAARFDLSVQALRLPSTLRDDWMNWYKRAPKERRGHRNELFTYLWADDLCRLIEALLATELPGFRTYMPAMKESIRGQSAQDLIREHYPDVPLKKPSEEIDALVDCSRITADCGWAPSDVLHFTEA